MNDLTRQEVDAKLTASEAKVDARLANFDTSVKTGFAELRATMADMRGDMHKNSTDIIKWVVATALGFGGVTIAVLSFVITNAGTRPAAPVQPPVIITLPQTVAPPAGQVPTPSEPERKSGAKPK